MTADSQEKLEAVAGDRDVWNHLISLLAQWPPAGKNHYYQKKWMTNWVDETVFKC